MRRTAMTLTGALMLSACFGAPQVEEAGGAPQVQPAPPAVQPVQTTPPGGQGTNGGSSTGGGGSPSGEDPEDQPPSKPTEAEAARFLIDAAFGVTREDMARVERSGYAAWIEAQMALPMTSVVARTKQSSRTHYSINTDLFWEGAVEGEDQLRQRVSFALSEMVVVSLQGSGLLRQGRAFGAYMDILREESFGNYEDLIRRVSLSPAMGMYLSHIGNRPGDPALGTAPDENFARELMQLFTIGLVELTPGGEPTGVPTYGQADVSGLAKVFTGFNWAGGTEFKWVHPDDVNVFQPMEGYPAYHDQSDKTFLGTTIPGGLSPEESVKRALDHILAHPNVAPFVCKQLIQRLVTSNPTPAYVARVGAAYESGRFEADGVAFGTGRRGDMAATVAAILLDEEAREADARPAQYGRVRPPLARFAHFARTFRDGAGAPTSGQAEDTGAMRYMADYGQHAMGPPSVFGYSRPGFVAPGTWTGDQGLAAPQMSLSSGASMVGYINTMARFVADRGDVPSRAFFTPDYAEWLPLAEEPTRLAEELDLVLTGRTMSEATRARIAEAASLIVPRDEGADLPGLDPETARRRVEVAVLMAVTAPAYGVQR